MSDDIRSSVRDAYGKIGAEDGSCCGGRCTGDETSQRMGYSAADVAGVPDGANLGLGCGNPHVIAALREGETVLDLGSGGGFDCFLASKAVGATGRVIGVDMTPEMVERARRNAARAPGYENVEFRLGEIEHLPVADVSIDVLLSNCVINLSPDKPAVFREAFRVLKPGGRLAVSDVVAAVELPPEIRSDLALYSACIAGAARIDELETMIAAAGFERVEIRPLDRSREFVREWVPGSGVEDYVVSATIEAIRP